MSPAPTAAELLRSIGLDVDGPARWGGKPTSRKPGIFAIELPEPCRSIELWVMRFHSEPVKAVARNGDGKEVAAASSPPSRATTTVRNQGR